MSASRHPVVRLSKAVANLLALTVVFPAAVTCWGEARLRPDAEAVFGFWTHVLAVLPGLPGLYLRRAFYSLTLRSCSLNCWIDFGVLFAHRTAHVEDEVYVGAYSMVGSARLRRGCLIGTRANLLSGSAQHELQPDGRWGSSDASRFQEIEIGEHAWIGEAAIIMANVGAGSQVSAGAVVSADVPGGIVVAGNPARFVRSLRPVETSEPPPGVEAPGADAGHIGFIDWLKCLGILLIIYGHLAGWAPLAALPPIYSKQLGVAFFLFVTGYSLNRDTRSRWHVAFNRLFEVYVFGLALAVIMSGVTYATQGRLQISNYAPLLGGVNVLFNFFPANPTTWYLGMYIHVILLWALFAHRIRVSIPLLFGTFVAEIAIRVLLMQTAGGFVAYMALPNWSTVFLLGCWYGQRRGGQSQAASHSAALGAGGALAASAIIWYAIAAHLPFEPTFPFMHLTGYGATTGSLLVSVTVSAVYLGTTWLTFLALAPLPAPGFVRFVARNTLIIFLAHMPVYYALQPVIKGLGASRLATSTILIIVCVPCLGLLSEAIHRGGRLRAWRDGVFSRFQARPRAL